MAYSREEVFEIVAKYCIRCLQDSGEALDYLKERGINDRTIEKFDIGYYPINTSKLLKDIDLNYLVDAGLVYAKDPSFSFLRNRLIFPFRNRYGCYVALSGRLLPQDEARQRERKKTEKKIKIRKYWHNTFNKRAFLYGLYQAKESIRTKNEVIVVEGQTDVNKSHQCGITNVVAAVGTAVTEKHIKILSRYAENLVFVFDYDPLKKQDIEKGQTKIVGERAWEKVQTHTKVGTSFRRVLIPARNGLKEDVDSFLDHFGGNEFLELITDKKEIEKSKKWNILKQKLTNQQF